ncbi:MAG: thiol:disulfide interchange protein DsbG [Gammaproteobacteria bacterium]|nr:MAG: thiol:disulfide interchange protein DsbG [Gammaproteobacteria bacterium]UTW43499.1 thiol:disulfide interchange protein DsbG [bacterium SCSIO 12844]
MVSTIFKQLSILVIFMFSLSACSSNNHDDIKASEKLIKKVSHNELHIVSQFNANNSLNGFVVENKLGNTNIVYTDKKASFLIVGSLFDAQGENQSEYNFNQYVQPQINIDAYNAAKNTAYIQEGNINAPHKAYIVTDPNCLYCHKLYQALSPEIKQGKLAIRWILIAAMKPSSADKAMTILSSHNPAKALEASEANLNNNIKLLSKSEVSESIKNKLNQNMSFMTKYKLYTMPTIFYKSQTNIIKIQKGLPNVPINEFISLFSNTWE